MRRSVLVLVLLLGGCYQPWHHRHSTLKPLERAVLPFQGDDQEAFTAAIHAVIDSHLLVKALDRESGLIETDYRVTYLSRARYPLDTQKRRILFVILFEPGRVIIEPRPEDCALNEACRPVGDMQDRERALMDGLAKSLRAALEAP